MLQVHDIRETRVYREAKEEGAKEAIQEEKLRTIIKLAARKMNAADIAEIVELDLDLVNRELAKSQASSP